MCHVLCLRENEAANRVNGQDDLSSTYMCNGVDYSSKAIGVYISALIVNHVSPSVGGEGGVDRFSCCRADITRSMGEGKFGG